MKSMLPTPIDEYSLRDTICKLISSSRDEVKRLGEGSFDIDHYNEMIDIHLRGIVEHNPLLHFRLAIYTIARADGIREVETPGNLFTGLLLLFTDSKIDWNTFKDTIEHLCDEDNFTNAWGETLYQFKAPTTHSSSAVLITRIQHKDWVNGRDCEICMDTYEC